MPRISAKSLVMGFVVLVTAAVLGLMALTPADGHQPGTTGSHDTTGHDTTGHDMTGH